MRCPFLEATAGVLPLRRRQEQALIPNWGAADQRSRGINHMRIEYLYRFPVKGLTAGAVERAAVYAAGAIAWDSGFALAQGDSGFDPANPVWLPKWNFMCQAKNARAALLFSVFDPGSKVLRVRAPDGSEVAANALTVEGRAQIGAFLRAFLGDDVRGEPTFEYVPG